MAIHGMPCRFVDPVTGMHQVFGSSLARRYFVSAPQTGFDQEWNPADIAELAQSLVEHHQQITRHDY